MNAPLASLDLCDRAQLLIRLANSEPALRMSPACRRFLAASERHRTTVEAKTPPTMSALGSVVGQWLPT